MFYNIITFALPSKTKLIFSGLRRFQPQTRQSIKFNSGKASKDAPKIPKNVIADVHSATNQTEKGVIYDKKPYKMLCVPGKKYAWCACGKSKSQPMCDGTHKNVHLRITMRPVLFQVEEEKEYWLCNCKQTSNRPFCDGTHKQEDIQAAVKS